MRYTKDEVMQYVIEEDVKFIRLAFCDVFGNQKNISIMPTELERAFEYGVAFDASSIAGFGDEAFSDLLLRPDPDTLTILPWRPESGRVVRMFCSIHRPDGRIFEADTRTFLKNAVLDAEKAGLSFSFGAEQEFYLFRLDDDGQPTKTPFDQAGYMDIAPADRGENVRREICLTLERMGIQPESSHHEEGPGQNEIDFRYSDPITAADNAMTFRTVVRTVADRSGLWADFSPKPLPDKAGSGFHINISVKTADGTDKLIPMIAGILDKAEEMTLFLNPVENSYQRLGSHKAPGYVSWSGQNRSQLVRIPAAVGEYRRAELRSPDPALNPYIAFALIIYAGMEGIARDMELPMAAGVNMYTADSATLSEFRPLPDSLTAAAKISSASRFITGRLPRKVLDAYLGR